MRIPYTRVGLIYAHTPSMLTKLSFLTLAFAINAQANTCSFKVLEITDKVKLSFSFNGLEEILELDRHGKNFRVKKKLWSGFKNDYHVVQYSQHELNIADQTSNLRYSVCNYFSQGTTEFYQCPVLLNCQQL